MRVIYIRGISLKQESSFDLTDKEIVLAPHQGIVSSKDWIKMPCALLE